MSESSVSERFTVSGEMQRRGGIFGLFRNYTKRCNARTCE